MGELTSKLVGQIVVMFILMAIGYALYRIRVIDDRGTKQMASVVIYIAFPALTLRTLMVDFDPSKLAGAGFCFVLTTVVTLVSIPLTRVFFSPEEGVARYGAIFSNSGFIGIPIVCGVLGSDYVFYLSVGTSCLTFFIWTYGVFLVSGDKDQMSLGQAIKNPNLVALAVGLVCFLLSVHPPALLDTALADMGNINTGLVMIVLGAYLAQSDLRAVITSRKAYLVCFVRLVLIPAIVLGIELLFPMVDAKVRMTMLVTLGAPVASFAAILAERFGGNYKFGVGIVSLSTFLSVVTMPALFAVASALM